MKKNSDKNKKFKLDRKVKKKWVDALLSGNYMKGTGQLKKQYASGNTTYCCLGVATEIGLCKASNKNIDCGHTKEDFLPLGYQHKLINLNDTKGWGFKRIATWIKKNL